MSFCLLSVIHSGLRKADMSPNPVWYMSPKERKDTPTGIDDTYVTALPDGFYDAFATWFVVISIGKCAVPESRGVSTKPGRISVNLML